MNAAKTLRLPPLATLIEWAARVGYGARGFVYLSAGALTLLAATDRIGDAVGTSGAAGWLAEQPFGKVWLVLLGLGLWAFVGWRVLQAVFDADHEGTDLKGWATRAGQAVSGLFYGVLASGVFEYLDEFGEATNASKAQAESVAEGVEVVRNRRVDLVILDVMMPEMDGLTATREIRKQAEWRKLPVIMLTARSSAHDAVDGLVRRVSITPVASA